MDSILIGGGWFEREVQTGFLTVFYFDVLLLRSKLFVPGRDFIVAGSKLEFIRAIRFGNGMVWVREDAGVGAHPLVNVALEGHRHFRLIEHVVGRHRSRLAGV